MTAKRVEKLAGTSVGIVRGRGKPQRITQNLRISLSVAIFIVLIVIVVLLLRHSDNSKKSVANAGCSTELISRTNSDLRNHNFDGLQNDVADAKKTQDYNQDQNCLYITMATGTLVGSKSLAQPAIDQLNKLSAGKPLTISKLFDNPLTTAEASTSVQADDEQQRQEDKLNRAKNADWAKVEAEQRK